jgi:hypothetical protein
MSVNGCQHLHTNTHTAVYRIHNAADPESPFFTFCVKVQCQDCGVLFRFLGDHSLPPEDVAEAQKRRLTNWTSAEGDELGCLIAPMGPSGGLDGLPVLGRA